LARAVGDALQGHFVITPERWIANLLEVAGAIADKQQQERRWLAPDRYAWEGPSELMCVIFDDCALEGFLERYTNSFSEPQQKAASEFRDTLSRFCDSTPGHLDPAETLADLRWEVVRQKAAQFVSAFAGKWPIAA
jgi:vancomycin resistance protein YoaR